MEAEGSMASKSNTSLGVIAFIVLTVMAGFIIWGIFHMWQVFWGYISHSDPTIGAGIIAAAATIIVSVLSIVLGRIFERSKELELRRWEIEQEIRKENLPRYQKLIEFLFKVLDASRTGTQMPQDEGNNFFISFTRKYWFGEVIDLSKIFLPFGKAVFLNQIHLKVELSLQMILPKLRLRLKNYYTVFAMIVVIRIRE